MATKLLYMDDFGVVTCEATVEAVKSTEDGRPAVILDQTCFYPRGGGQDWDTGKLNSFIVNEVRMDENGDVWHIGEGAAPMVGEPVECKVDIGRRDSNTRLHSAGHVLDMAMSTVYPDLVPGKGAHYPHMSFVEYQGEPDRDIQGELQAKIDELLRANITNTLRYVSKEELAQLCRHVPDNIPSNKPTRVVLYGDYGVPCGGTHVQHLNDIGKIEVTKVKSKKGITKVGYRVEGIN
ncbi:MAG TPA: alanine--tRNA ligase-related protein [Patescibacteria group bacterium]|nr:alanine--tRNA ligase-related protein [Patescibacteria group bacterium]